MKVILKSGERFNINQKVFTSLIENLNKHSELKIEVFHDRADNSKPFLMINMNEVAAII